MKSQILTSFLLLELKMDLSYCLLEMENLTNGILACVTFDLLFHF